MTSGGAQRLKLIVTIVAALTVATACGTSSKSSTAPAASTRTSPAPNTDGGFGGGFSSSTTTSSQGSTQSSGDDDLDPCTIVSLDALTAASGLALTGINPDSAHGANTGCSYSGASAGTKARLDYVTFGGAKEYSSQRSQYSQSGTVTDVPGVGDQAFAATGPSGTSGSALCAVRGDTLACLTLNDETNATPPISDAVKNLIDQLLRR